MIPKLYTSYLTDILPLSMYSGAVYPLHENILIIEHKKINCNRGKKRFVVLINAYGDETRVVLLVSAFSSILDKPKSVIFAAIL